MIHWRRRLAQFAGQSDDYKEMPTPPAPETAADADLGLAILVAESANNTYEPLAVVATIAEASEVAKQDLAARMADLEGGREPLCPEAYVVWARGQDGAYRRLHTITPALEKVAAGLETTLGQPQAGHGASLLITAEGFLNLEQACEYRLRYTDVTKTDEVWAVDIVMSNGSSHLIKHDDPGFDQLIDVIEEQGYVISTKDRE